MWWIPLQSHVINLNLHTLLINGATVQESINSLYTNPSSVTVLENIDLTNNNQARPSAAETIHNVYKIPSIERTIQYLHAAAGFPTKYTLIKNIRNGNYLIWPLITVTNFQKNFPESEET